MHQIRIHQRHDRNEKVIEALLQEIRISLQYNGPDVTYSNGVNELKIDHEDDFVIYAILALLSGQSGDWVDTEAFLKKSSHQIKQQWGNGGLTETANSKDSSSYTLVLVVLEQLVRLSVEHDQIPVAFKTLEIIDEFSWSNAARLMMETCCRCNKFDSGIELLRFLAEKDWSPEEEHPLEIAAKLGAQEIVTKGEEFVTLLDFQYALHTLILHFLSAKEYSKANPLFAKLITTFKSPDGVRNIIEWTMVVSVLGRSKVNSQKLTGAQTNLERCFLRLNKSERELHAWHIVDACRDVSRLAPWT